LETTFGFGKTKDFAPFLLLDNFRNDHPEDYLTGFPWHSHGGIETITCAPAGSDTHGAGLGNRGQMTACDIHWIGAANAHFTGLFASA
jgi:redox-sensitive bicupin YhaK (pirin superfamily)